MLTQGAEGTPGSEGAPAGFDIKEGGLGSAAQALALATLCGVLFLTFLDNTVVSVGLANVQSDLHAGVTSLQWVVNGYALTFASFMLVAGMLGDIFGRKRVMLVGVAIFCAGSVVAATASNVDWLIVGRVVMGIGAAASEPGTLSIIRHVYPDRKTRADALGIWAAVSGLALALGPVIGGFLVGFSSWRAIFWFNLGFGIVAFVLAAVAVPETSDRQGRSIDVLGFIFGAAFLACLSFAVIQGETSGYTASWIEGLFVACGVSGVAFVITEKKVKSPMLDLSMFRLPPFAGSNFVAFVAYFGTFSIFFFTALYLQVVADASAYQTAVDFLPMAAGLIIVSALTGPLVARVGPRWPMAFGCLLAGGGILVANAVLSPTVNFATLGWVLPLAGIGIGMLLVPVTSVPLYRGASGALGHGGLGHQHQSGDGRRVRRGHPRVDRQCQAHRRPRRQAEGDRDPAEFPEPGGARDPDRWCLAGRSGDLGRTQQERGGREDRHQSGERRLRRVRIRTPRGIAPVRLPDPGGRRRGSADDPSQAGGDLRGLARAAVHA